MDHITSSEFENRFLKHVLFYQSQFLTLAIFCSAGRHRKGVPKVPKGVSKTNRLIYKVTGWPSQTPFSCSQTFIAIPLVFWHPVFLPQWKCKNLNRCRAHNWGRVRAARILSLLKDQLIRLDGANAPLNLLSKEQQFLREIANAFRGDKCHTIKDIFCAQISIWQSSSSDWCFFEQERAKNRAQIDYSK